MKKILALCLILFGMNGKLTRLQANDTLTKRFDSLVKADSTNFKQLNIHITALDSAVKKKPAVAPIASCASCEPGLIGYLLILLPATLFLLLTFYFLSWLKREKFKLSDALSNDTPNAQPTITAKITNDPNDAAKVLSTETKSEPNYSRSASRLIAFLTALAAIIIALCMITLYAYGYITKNGDIPKMDELWKIIAGLGIGVVPYASKVIGEKPAVPAA
jgi:hypothetical protein